MIYCWPYVISVANFHHFLGPKTISPEEDSMVADQLQYPQSTAHVFLRHSPFTVSSSKLYIAMEIPHVSVPWSKHSHPMMGILIKNYKSL